MMTTDEESRLHEILMAQFDVAWGLLSYHLQRLSDDDLFWTPAQVSWTMHRVDGRWYPDWSEAELDPTPTPDVAWLTWHIGWWWAAAIDHIVGLPASTREDVRWPGSARAVIGWLEPLNDRFRLAVREAVGRFREDAAFPWPAGSGRTVADLVAWVIVELTKNAAEIGILMLLRRAQGSQEPANGRGQTDVVTHLVEGER